MQAPRNTAAMMVKVMSRSLFSLSGGEWPPGVSRETVAIFATQSRWCSGISYNYFGRGFGTGTATVGAAGTGLLAGAAIGGGSSGSWVNHVAAAAVATMTVNIPKRRPMNDLRHFVNEGAPVAVVAALDQHLVAALADDAGGIGHVEP